VTSSFRFACFHHSSLSRRKNTATVSIALQQLSFFYVRTLRSVSGNDIFSALPE
jgi:hypothetical protein